MNRSNLLIFALVAALALLSALLAGCTARSPRNVAAPAVSLPLSADHESLPSHWVVNVVAILGAIGSLSGIAAIIVTYINGRRSARNEQAIEKVTTRTDEQDKRLDNLGTATPSQVVVVNPTMEKSK